MACKTNKSTSRKHRHFNQTLHVSVLKTGHHPALHKVLLYNMHIEI
jgi:hypothetical protein